MSTTETKHANIYAYGMCFLSACAPEDWTAEQVERSVNTQAPTGLSHGWTVADEPFATGEPNPHLADGCGRHWLLSC